MSTVDHIKEIALEKFDWDGVKDDRGRRLLSDLKDASTRYNIGPFKKIVTQIDNLNKYYGKDYIILSIIHCREPEEIQRFKDYYHEDCKTILIKRKTDIITSNHADSNVDKYDYDFVINNDGDLDSFYEICKQFYANLIITDLI